MSERLTFNSSLKAVSISFDAKPIVFCKNKLLLNGATYQMLDCCNMCIFNILFIEAGGVEGDARPSIFLQMLRLHVPECSPCGFKCCKSEVITGDVGITY